MVLEFDFQYNADNDNLAFLLNFYAQNHAHDLSFSGKNLLLKIKGDEAELVAFCECLERISHSVFLQGFDVRAGEDFKPQKRSFESEKVPLITHFNTQAYTQNKTLKANEWGVFCAVEFSPNGDSFKAVREENFAALLRSALEILTSGGAIYLKNHRGIFELSLYDGVLKGDFLMPCDIKALPTAFICSNEKLKLLASLEKPLMWLKFSAIFRQNHKLGTKDFRVKMAEDLFSFALGHELYGQDFKFLSVKKLQNFKDEFELLNFEGRTLILRGFDFIRREARELIFAKEDKNMARLSYLLSTLEESALILELSEDYEDLLLFDKSFNLLKLTLPQNSQTLYADINEDAVGARLLQNYQQEFPLLNEDFEVKNNFFSLFCILGRILGLSEDFVGAGRRLLEVADGTKMPRGVKIDYRLREDKSLDHTRTLRSAMSFKLAGVEAENIAYGAVESLAFFLRDFYDELREKNQVQSAIISGSLFRHTSLLKNTLKHLKNCQTSHVPLCI
ncbi:hypothetical protein [Campylobacter sp.]|uniref:hypothetical protein n=1 Tax=Campylobacter sp. TaxID=205 RepID=UPI0026DB11AC|nr:hypothetical protein [Campylobacter sp.]MDO4673940.1 hypothetical protein [Campylobacter sp.]